MTYQITASANGNRHYMGADRMPSAMERRRRRGSPRGLGCQPQQMGGLIDKVKKTIKKITPKEIQKYSPGIQIHKAAEKFVGKNAKIIAPIAAFIPGFGWAIALGVSAAGAQYEIAKGKAQAVKAAKGNAQNLLAEYKQIAGTVPGRALGADTLQSVLSAALRGNMLNPEVSKWASKSDAWAANAITGCAKCGKSIKQSVQEALKAGVTDPTQIAEQYVIPGIDSTWGEKWIPHDQLSSQLMIDIIDALAASIDPNVPFYYGIPQGDVTGSSPTSAPPTTPVTTPVLPVPVAPVTPISTPVASVDTKALIDTLLAQGATQQQAFSQVMSSLVSKGVQPTSDVQSAVATQVREAGGISPTYYWVGGALLAAGLLYMVTRKRGR